MINVRIVLVHPQHPGNIGATARAMKTMGFHNLVLVNPKDFPSQVAVERASNADDVLNAAKVVATFEEAIADCQLVLGTSSRERIFEWPQLTARQLGELVCEKQANTNIAIVFGAERTGLTNEQLEQCHYHVTIPANPDYMSLNLASAVQLICYECYAAFDACQQKKCKKLEPLDTLSTGKELQGMFAHLEETLTQIEFFNPENPKKLMTRIRRLFQRAQCSKIEVNIIRGICQAISRKIGV